MEKKPPGDKEMIAALLEMAKQPTSALAEDGNRDTVQRTEATRTQ